MPSGGKGATAKIYIETEVIDNFKEQAAKIKSGLGKGIKEIKDLDLNFGFNEKSMAEAASKELEGVMNIMTSEKFNKLDFSGIIPPMVEMLKNNSGSVKDEIKLQVIQGLREGFENLGSVASSIDIDYLARNKKSLVPTLLGSTAIKDIIQSLGLSEEGSKNFREQFKTTMSLGIGSNGNKIAQEGFAKDIAQLLSLKATRNAGYDDVLKYLVSGTYRTSKGKDISIFEADKISEALDTFELKKKGEKGKLTENDVKNFAGYLERLKYLAEMAKATGKDEDATKYLEGKYESIVDDPSYNSLLRIFKKSGDANLLEIFTNTRKRVAEANKEKDRQYNDIDWRSFSSNWEETLDKLIVAAGDENTLGKILPNIKGWDGKSKQFTADELLTETIQYMQREAGIRDDNEAATRAEEAATRSEAAAEKAEAARDKTQEIANGIEDKVKQAMEKGETKTPESKTAPKKDNTASSSTPSTKKAEDAAQIAEEKQEELKTASESIETSLEKLKTEREKLESEKTKLQDEITKDNESLKLPEDKKTYEFPKKTLSDLKDKTKKIDEKIIDNAINQLTIGKDPVEYAKGQVWDANRRRVTKYVEALVNNPILGIADDKNEAQNILKLFNAGDYAANSKTLLFSLFSKASKENKGQFNLDKLIEEWGMSKDSREKLAKMLNELNANYSDMINFSDTNGLGNITLKEFDLFPEDKIKKQIQEREKRIKELDNLLKDNQRKEQELRNKQQGQKPIETKATSESKQQGSSPEVSSAQEASDLQKARGDLEKERTALEQEIQKANQTLDDAQGILTITENSIDKLEKQITTRDTAIQRNINEKDKMETEAQQMTEELWGLTNNFQEIREKREQAEKELKEFEKETTQIRFGEDYLKKVSIEGEIGLSEKIIESLTQDYQRTNEELLELENAMDNIPEMPKGKAKAYEYLKQVAEERKKIHEAYKKAITDRDSAEDIDQIIEGDKIVEAAEKDEELAELKYFEAWKNAVKEGVNTNRIESYVANGDNFLSNGKNFTNDEFGGSIPSNIGREFYYKNRDEVDSLNFAEEYTGLEIAINQRKERLKLFQEQIKEEEEEAKKLKESLGDDWEDNKFENRVAKSEIKKKEIEELQNQEIEAESVHRRKEIDLDFNQKAIQKRDKYISQLVQSQEEDKATLEQLKQQREDQQKIYDEAEKTQTEKAQRLQEVKNLIAENQKKEEELKTKQTQPDTQTQPQTQAIKKTEETLSAFSSTDFNTLILALTEIYELLGQFPEALGNFNTKIDIAPLVDQFKTLSDSIAALPKEGFNISLGEEFDNLSQKIGKALDKMTELTSQVQTEEISKGIAEKYDAQIQKLTEDAKVAKEAIEELQRTNEELKKSISTTAVSKKEEITPYPEDKQIAKEYEHLKEAQDKVFKANNIQEYNAALEEVRNTLQNIKQLEEQAMLAHASQSDLMFMAFGDTPSKSYLDRFPETTAAKADTTNNIRTVAKDYIEKQKAEIQAMADAIKSMNIDAVEKEMQGSNWNKKRVSAYNDIIEGANAASTAIEVLNKNLDEMSTKGVDPQIIESFLTLKESTQSLIAETQGKNDIFTKDVESAKDNLISKLDTAQKRLEAIKKDSGKLINIDPTMQGALDKVEEHLKKIKQLKDEVNKNPLKAIDPNFSRSANSYASTLNGKGKNTGVIGGLEQISDRYTTDFNRTTQNYGKYATALKKLFDDMSKGADASLKTVLKDMERVDYLAERLTNATGIEQGQLLSKELDKRFDPSVVDAQSAAEAKATTSYENMLSKIEKRAKEAQLRMQNIFGENGIENLGERFVAGNVEGFDKFVENANNAQRSLTDLQGILEQAGDNPAFLLQEGNVERLVTTMGQLDTAIQNVSGNASKFEIADSLDVDKLRASATQFLRKESGLSVDEITQIQQVIDQLQGQINKTDFSHLKDQLEGIKQSAIEAGHTGGTFFDMLGQRFKSMAAYLLSFASFYRIIGVFKDGISIVKQLDSALVEMNKVSTESLATLREYQKESFSTANDVGTTATQLQQSTADFIRLGESFQEAKESARVANELMTVSEFNNIQDATTALVSISAAYEDAANGLDKQAIVDKLNKIGDEYAISTDGLATALQDSASALTTANNDMDEAAALIAAGNTVTQDPSKTGK